MRRTQKFIVAAIMLLISFMLIGCTSSAGNVAKTTNGYILTPGITCEVNASNIQFSYKVLEDHSKIEEMEGKAHDLVFSWWGDSSTFKEPVDIIPVEIYGDSAPRGFQDDGYIFIDPSKEDSFCTLVHEYIHVQNPLAFIYEDGSGRELMEMYVETVAINLVGLDNAGIPTDNYIFFQSCPKLSMIFSSLDTAFKNGLTGDDAFVPIYGSDAYLIVMLLDSFYDLPNVFTEEAGLNEFSQQVLGLSAEELMAVYEDFNNY